MPDPITTGEIVAGTTFAMKKLSGPLKMIFGPSAEEVGIALRRYTERRLHNVGRIVENAESKSADHGTPGSVPMRVAMRILEEGSYSDDTLVLEYLGGVLASSRTKVGRDDRGNTYTSLVSRMSTYDLRTHYIFYSEIRRVLLGKDVALFDVNDRDLYVFIPMRTYIPAMDFSSDENPRVIQTSTLHNLKREGLIDFEVSGKVDSLQRYYPLADEPGAVVRATATGIELYLWAQGQGQMDHNVFLSPDLQVSMIEEVSIPPLSVHAMMLRSDRQVQPPEQTSSA